MILWKRPSHSVKVMGIDYNCSGNHRIFKDLLDNLVGVKCLLISLGLGKHGNCYLQEIG